MNGYVLGRDAEQDLDDLWSYIAEDSVDAADRLIARLFDAFEKLARIPRMGHERDDLTNFQFFSGRSENTSSSTGRIKSRSRLSP